ncbi:DUF4139 domain-containing protein [Calditrichota bacterium LG25]
MKNYLALKVSLALLALVGWLSAQSDLSITVTGQNLGLVHERREIDLKKGVSEYWLTDIPQQIDATSVLVESPDNAFLVLEQNYEYDLINVSKVLDKSIDRQIWVEDPALGQISGKLLANNAEYLMLLDEQGQLQILPRNDKQKVLLKDYARQKDQFITKPTLVWKVKARKAGKHPLVLTYLTRGLKWRADYVGRLKDDDQQLQLACWVTIENRSGRAYNNARLKLMAGELNIVRDVFQRKSMVNRLMATAATRESQFEEKEFFEYHLYTLEGRTTLLNNQIKQIQLFPETAVKVKKSFVVTSYAPQKVEVKIKFKNSKQNNLGIPFPAGKVRLYKEDGQDLEFIGEDTIEHTPRNEEILLTVGRAFDLVSKRNVLKTERPSKEKEKRTIEYVLRNHKKQDVLVEIIEYVPSYRQVELLSSNFEALETKANYLKFKIPVKAGGKNRLEIKYLLK